jgi:hypothetical protein
MSNDDLGQGTQMQFTTVDKTPKYRCSSLETAKEVLQFVLEPPGLSAGQKQQWRMPASNKKMPTDSWVEEQPGSARWFHTGYQGSAELGSTLGSQSASQPASQQPAASGQPASQPASKPGSKPASSLHASQPAS